MIKRRYYKQDHGDRDDVSDSSSSSSSSESDSPSDEEEEEEIEMEGGEGSEDDEESNGEKGEGDDEEVESEKEVEQQYSSFASSGYESEDSSGKEIKCDASGLLVNDDEDNIKTNKQSPKDKQTPTRGLFEVTEEETSKNVEKAYNLNSSVQAGVDECVVKCKSVFKCKLCPRIVCLSEATLMAHLKSTRHARSKKLLEEGRLKLMLNSDGEIEEEYETHAERHARTIALAQKADKNAAPKKIKGRQRQRLRRKAKLEHESKKDKTKPSMKNPVTKKPKV